MSFSLPLSVFVFLERILKPPRHANPHVPPMAIRIHTSGFPPFCPAAGLSGKSPELAVA
jgi:hypothetical protein